MASLDLTDWSVALENRFNELNDGATLPHYFLDLSGDDQRWMVNYWNDKVLHPLIKHTLDAEMGTVAISNHRRQIVEKTHRFKNFEQQVERSKHNPTPTPTSTDGIIVKHELQRAQSSPVEPSVVCTHSLPEMEVSTRSPEDQTENDSNVAQSRNIAVNASSLPVSASSAPTKEISYTVLNTWAFPLRTRCVNLFVAGQLPNYFHNLSSEDQNWAIDFWLDPNLLPPEVENAEDAANFIEFHRQQVKKGTIPSVSLLKQGNPTQAQSRSTPLLAVITTSPDSSHLHADAQSHQSSPLSAYLESHTVPQAPALAQSLAIQPTPSVTSGITQPTTPASRLPEAGSLPVSFPEIRATKRRKTVKPHAATITQAGLNLAFAQSHPGNMVIPLQSGEISAQSIRHKLRNPSTHDVNTPNQSTWVLFVGHSPSIASSYERFESLSGATRNEIVAAFTSQYYGNPRRVSLFDAYMKSLGANIYCVNHSIYRSKEKANPPDNRACEKCVKSNRLCVRLVQLDDKHSLCFYPKVPFEGQSWQETSTWI